MKATIDGIVFEGTPQEIIDFKLLNERVNKDKAQNGLELPKGMSLVFKPGGSYFINDIIKEIKKIQR